MAERLLAALMAAVLSGVPAHAAEGMPRTEIAAALGVTLEGVTAAGGTVRVQLFDEATFPALDPMPLAERDVGNAAGDLSVRFTPLPPGTYAVRAFQDVNGDGRAQPGEPQGVSNGADPRDFAAAAVQLAPGMNTLAVRLR